MSNHPHQRPRRNDDDVPESGAPMGALPTPVNGHGAALRPSAAKAIGEAAGAAMAGTLGQVLPPLLSGAFTTALSEAAVRTVPELRLWCGPCLVRRLNWERAHEEDLRAAIEQMAVAAQVMPEGDPRRNNPLMFLPPHLLPSMDPEDPHPDAIPEPALAVTMIGGTLVCGADAAGTTGPGDAARPALLVAQGPLPDGTLARVFSQLRGRAA